MFIARSGYCSRLAICAMALAVTFSLVGEGRASLPFDTFESSQYLIIGRERINGNTDVSTNNFELGANKAPVPSTGNFLNNGSTGGPTLLGAVPNLPANAAPVQQGIGGSGNIAVTDPQGSFKLQDVGVYADPAIGIRIAGTSNSLNQSSNSFFNDPNHFPNTFDTNTQTGFLVNPNDADQSTRIDPPGNGGFNAGVTFGYNFTSLISELSTAASTISGLASTGVLNTSSGVINVDTTYTVGSGLNVIDIVTNNNDFSLNNVNFVIDGPADATVIFRLPGNDNMLISNSNILIGNGGIGYNNVLFFTAQAQNDTHFSFNNSIVNGAAFWSLGPVGGRINFNNGQGCTQLIADVVDLNNVRFMNCTFVPEPGSLVLLGLVGFALTRRRLRSR